MPEIKLPINFNNQVLFIEADKIYFSRCNATRGNLFQQQKLEH